MFMLLAEVRPSRWQAPYLTIWQAIALGALIGLTLTLTARGMGWVE